FGDYEVTFDHGPIGLSVEADYYGTRAIVRGFAALAGGREAPARACGRIRPGDYLTHVDGECVVDVPFERTLELLKNAQAGRFSLRLRGRGVGAWGARGGVNDGVEEARRAIFEAKARFFTAPRADDGMVYCGLTRHRGRHVTAFALHRDDTGEFLLACSMEADGTGPMIFHTQQDSHLRMLKDITTAQDSASYLGCMVPNFLGTEFRLMDFRESPERAGKYEVCAVVYDVNVLGRVPNFFRLLLRRPRTGGDGGGSSSARRPAAAAAAEGARRRGRGGGVDAGLALEQRARGWGQRPQRRLYQWRCSSRCLNTVILRRLATRLMHAQVFSDGSGGRCDTDDAFSIHRCSPARSLCHGAHALRHHDSSSSPIHQCSPASDIMVLETKRPSWNPALEAWVLNFNGRVRIPSKKNFLGAPERGNLAMETEFGDGAVLLRHGKMSKARFSVDFRHPLPPIVALAVCCSTFAQKRVVT
ncbi:tubby C-terminal-like domain-containing protein, partial [Tribonema minus]